MNPNEPQLLRLDYAGPTTEDHVRRIERSGRLIFACRQPVWRDAGAVVFLLTAIVFSTYLFWPEIARLSYTINASVILAIVFLMLSWVAGITIARRIAGRFDWILEVDSRGIFFRGRFAGQRFNNSWSRWEIADLEMTSNQSDLPPGYVALIRVRLRSGEVKPVIASPREDELVQILHALRDRLGLNL